MATEAYGNSATIGTTEYSLPSNSTTLSGVTGNAGAFQLVLDINAITHGDEFEVKFYDKCITSSTRRVLKRVVISGNLPDDIIVFAPVILIHDWEITITKLTGTDRSITWSIRKA